MADSIKKPKKLFAPIEKHNTAAWANIDETKPASNVAKPSEMQVDNAKDYVDENEK